MRQHNEKEKYEQDQSTESGVHMIEQATRCLFEQSSAHFMYQEIHVFVIAPSK